MAGRVGMRSKRMGFVGAWQAWAIRPLAAYATGLVIFILVIGLALERAPIAGRTIVEKFAALFTQTSEQASSRQPPVTRSAVLDDDAWLQGVRRQFSSGGSSSTQRSGLLTSAPQQAPDFFGSLSSHPRSDDGDSSGGGYRTVCVRLCDGYYWPISYSTSRGSFSRDQKTCENSCTTPARLFAYRNPGQEPEDMEDVRGQPYKKLSTAFAYRTTYDQSCKCKPHPWEQQARDQHRVYVLEAKTRKGDKQATAELEHLKQSLKLLKRAEVSDARTSRKEAKLKRSRPAETKSTAAAEAGGGSAGDDAVAFADAISAATPERDFPIVSQTDTRISAPVIEAKKARTAKANTGLMKLGAGQLAGDGQARRAAESRSGTRPNWTVSVFEPR